MASLNTAIVDRLLNSPAGRQAAEDERQAQLARRRDLAAQLVASEAPRLKQAAQLRTALDQAEAGVKLAQEKLRQAFGARQRAVGALVAASAAYDQVRRPIEAELRLTSASSIDTAIERLDLMTDTARRRGVEGTAELRGDTDTHHGRLVSVSTRASVEAHVAGIRSARLQLDALRLEPIDDEGVSERVAVILAGIPVITYQPVAA